MEKREKFFRLVSILSLVLGALVAVVTILLFPTIYSVIATVAAVELGFLLCTGKAKKEPVIEIPLWFFLVTAVLTAWHHTIPVLFHLAVFTYEGLPDFLSRIYSAVLLSGIGTLLFRREFRGRDIASRFGKPLCFLMALLLVFALGSFLFIDYSRIARAGVLPLNLQTGDAAMSQSDVLELSVIMENDPGGSTGGLPIPDPTGIVQSITSPPRMRLLSAEAEFASRVLFPMTAGLVAAVALLFTYMRTTAIMSQAKNTTMTLENTQEQMKLTAMQLENTQKQLISDQFKNAINHLGSESQSVVLGGVHTLLNIAGEYDEYRRSVFEILCSFVREETNNPDYQRHVMQKLAMADKSAMPITFSDLESAEPPPPVSLIVVQTVVDKLFCERASREIFSTFRANLSDAFLRGSVLDYVQMPAADMHRTDLQGTSFNWANLLRANLNQANLQDSLLFVANLQESLLHGANLKNAKLTGANLQRAWLNNADLQGAKLNSANLRMAKLFDANLQGAKMNHTSIDTQTELERAVLQDVVVTPHSPDPPFSIGFMAVRIFDGVQEIKMTRKEKLEWFRKRNAVIVKPAIEILVDKDDG